MYDLPNRIVGRQSHALPLGLKLYTTAFAIVTAIGASSGAFVSPSNAVESGPSIADFSGYWARFVPGREAARFDPPDSGPGPVDFGAEAGPFRQGMPFIGDDTNPILLPHAAAAIRAQRDTHRRDEPVWSPWGLCRPAGVPLVFSMINAVQFLQSEDQVTIIYQRGQTTRHVYLDEGHPSEPPLSWFGHSVGHYEGEDTLVIDTITQDPRTLTDRFGTPKSEAMRIAERYSISADGQRLNVEFKVEDPKTFTTAWSAKFVYSRFTTRGGEGPQEPIFAEIICPENSRDASGVTRPIPTATNYVF